MTETDHLIKLETQLQQEINAAYAVAARPPTADDIAQIVRQVLKTLSGDITASDLKFYAELEELAAYIRNAKQEIAAIQPGEITDSHIPHATNELDAVVGATEDATNKIMDVCDTITAIAGQCPPELGEQLIACTTNVYEACNFQDITGQRIKKVVQTLKYIDEKIAAILTALGNDHHPSGIKQSGNAVAADPDKALLNGPQLPQHAIDQDAIDRLMSGR